MTDYNFTAATLAAARSGDVVAARSLIREFVATVQQNRRADGRPHLKPSGLHTQFDERLLDYLAECFAKIDKLTTADIALNLASTGKRGRKTNTATRAEQLRRGRAAWELVTKKNFALEDALYAVADDEERAYDTIKRDYQLWKALLRSLG